MNFNGMSESEGLLERIAGLDISRGMERFGGNENIYMGMLRSYTLITPAFIEAIREISVNYLPEISSKVHGIKWASRSICADDVGNKAEALELAAKAGDIDYFTKHCEAFLDAAWQLVFEINETLFRINMRGKPDQEYYESLPGNEQFI